MPTCKTVSFGGVKTATSENKKDCDQKVKEGFNCGRLRNSLRLIRQKTPALMAIGLVGSKLRKREEHRGDTPTHPHGVIQEAEHVVTPAHPPPFLWRYSGNNNNSSQFNLVNSSQDTLVTTVPCEDGRECKGFKKNLRGKLKKIVLKKPQEVYTIPAELRPQLKQIYVY